MHDRQWCTGVPEETINLQVPELEPEENLQHDRNPYQRRGETRRK